MRFGLRSTRPSAPVVADFWNSDQIQWWPLNWILCGDMLGLRSGTLRRYMSHRCILPTKRGRGRREEEALHPMRGLRVRLPCGRRLSG